MFIRMLPANRCKSCPICGVLVREFAVVGGSNAPGLPESTAFWPQGDRVLIHSVEGAWCHFRIGNVHKLAYLTELATVPGLTRNGG